MKFISVSTKLNIAIIGISLTSILLGSLILFWYEEQIKLDIYNQTKTELLYNANEKINAKMEIGITNAISIANDERIQKALANNNRQAAISSLEDISLQMKKYTHLQNIKIHIHTNENISFLRNWKLDKYGDDLSSFRDTVVCVNREHKPIVSFEPGRAGLLLRAVIPIVTKEKQHLGSMEFIQGINSIAKEFQNYDTGFLLLMDEQINHSIKTGNGFSFNKENRFKNYIISQQFVNKIFLNDAQNIDMGRLFTNGYFVSSQYFYTYKTVEDFQNKKLGIILLAKPLSLVNATIEKANTLIYIALFGIFAMAVIISIVIIIAIRKLVTNPLKIFENALFNFFLFLQGKKILQNLSYSIQMMSSERWQTL